MFLTFTFLVLPLSMLTLAYKCWTQSTAKVNEKVINFVKDKLQLRPDDGIKRNIHHVGDV